MRLMLALASLVLLVSAPPAATQDRARDERAVRELVATIGAALNARDWDAVASVFAGDGDLILQERARVSGRVAIRAFWQQLWSNAPAERRITLTVRSLRFLGPDVAIADCTAEFSAGKPARDRATYVVARRAGKWQVAALRVLPAEETRP